MSGMLGTICLIMMGLSFAGVVETCGAIHVILARAMKLVLSDHCYYGIHLPNCSGNRRQ